MPKAILDNIKDEDLEAVAGMAESAVSDVKQNSVKQVELQGRTAFEVDTPFFKMVVPIEHMGFFVTLMGALTEATVKVWDDMPSINKARMPGGQVGLSGAILAETAQTVLEYVHSQEDLMEELQMNDALTSPIKRKTTDVMYG